MKSGMAALLIFVALGVLDIGALPIGAEMFRYGRDPALALNGARNGASSGAAILQTADLLNVPSSVVELAKKPGAEPFVVASAAPSVDIAFPPNLRGDAAWSAWGDIAVTSDGRVYLGVGDHADDAGGKARAYIYRWDPATKRLEQILDVNAIVKRDKGEPTFSKVHARIDEGPDGKIYFTGTLNNGARAQQSQYK